MLNAAIFYSICNNHRFYREPFDEACWALGVSNVSTSNFKEIFLSKKEFEVGWLSTDGRQ